MKEEPCFKTRARILCQLGEQLIKNESIALLELIKNAYDADATECTIEMTNPSNQEKGAITICDDGEGMSYETIANVWLEIGTDYKEKQSHDNNTKRTTKFNRMRLGEKGIGRLGAHRLGHCIELVSHAAGAEEVVLEIDWDTATDAKMIEDIPIKLNKRQPTVFSDQTTGTKIIITKLRTAWTRKMVRDCARTISALNSPFESNESFRALFSIKGNSNEESWLNGLLSYDAIQNWKLYSFDITMQGCYIQHFCYKFTPWPTMPKLSARTVEWGASNVLARLVKKNQNGVSSNNENIDLHNPDIGTIRFQGAIFDRDAKTLSLGLQDKAGLKEYLDNNGGVRVYRDNMRVLDYGEPGNDWLDLNSRRVNRPGIHISNNVIIAAVYLDRESSSMLKEKANREGFLENDAFFNLREALEICLQRVEMERRVDKDILRKSYEANAPSQPVMSSVTELKETIEETNMDPQVKEKITRYLVRIESEYNTISDSLLRSAGAGLNLIMVIHQMEKMLKNVQALVKAKGYDEDIEIRIRDISSLVEGYSILVRNSEKKERNLKTIVNQAVFDINFRLQSHGIRLDNLYKERNDIKAIYSENHILNALLNVFDNSIWWMDYARIQQPSILVDISDILPNYSCIIIADNGPGFTKPTSEIIKPFFSDKPSGMGIGLHLTDQIMKSLDGKLLFPGLDIFDIPDKYQKGAIIALALPKEKK